MTTAEADTERASVWHRPAVFAGPSIGAQMVREMIPDAVVMPPVARDDLYRVREAGYSHVLIIDGSFTHGFAVSPREVIDVIRDGAVVLGASSMGAIRAAECWPAGMQGVGLVYRLYRRQALQSDDEVVVATNPDDGHRAMSCALINVRCAARRAVRAGLINPSDALMIVETAEGLHFARRTWGHIFEDVTTAAGSPQVRALCGEVDVKREDAVRGLRRLIDQLKASRPSAPGARKPHPIARQARYPGHDPLYGHVQPALRVALLQWLFGSGRYQRYVWPLVVTDPVFGAMESSPGRRPGALRSGLAEALARALEDVDGLAERLWAELEFLDELEAELARWYAVRRVAESAEAALNPTGRRRIREEVAIAHGAVSWSSLLPYVDNGRLFGAIPFDWIEMACDLMAQARASLLNVRPPTLPPPVVRG